jgi:hypothetical protein
MIVDMSIIEEQLVQILTNCVENYDAIYKGKAKNYGVTAEDVVVSIVFDDDSAPVGLSKVFDMDETAKLTIEACRSKDHTLLPALLQHKRTGAVFAAGIGRNSFCVFNISGDFGVVHEVEICS